MGPAKIEGDSLLFQRSRPLLITLPLTKRPRE
jgi:hypothetical protein